MKQEAKTMLKEQHTSSKLRMNEILAKIDKTMFLKINLHFFFALFLVILVLDEINSSIMLISFPKLRRRFSYPK
jgi:hypothetical protein